MTPSRYPPYPDYRDSGVDWLGEIPAHWDIPPLFAVVRERKEHNKGNVVNNVLSLSYGRIIRRNVESNFGLMPESFETYQIVHPGNIVLRLTDLQNDKRSLRVGLVMETGIITSAYACLDLGRFDAGFGYYLLHAYDVMKVFYTMGAGVRQTMKFEDLKRLPLLVPPLPEQRAIADFLDRETARLDALIDAKRRLIELLKEKRAALISHVVTKGLDPNVPMKDSGIEWIGEIPAHWEVKRLMNLTQESRPIMYGIVLPGPNVEEGVLIVKGGDVAPGRLRLSVLNRTTYEIESHYARSRLKAGDIVYAIRGSIGAAEIVPEEIEGANLTQDAARVAPRDHINRDWLLYAVTSMAFFAQLDAKAMGATIRGINIRDLKRGYLAFPPAREQEDIGRNLSNATTEIDGLIGLVERAIERLQEYRTAPIAAVVTGKIDVREEI